MEWKKVVPHLGEVHVFARNRTHVNKDTRRLTCIILNEGIFTSSFWKRERQERKWKKGKKEKENTRKGKVNVIGSVCAQNTNLANSSIRGLRGKTKEARDAQCHPRSPGALYLAWKYYVNVIVSKDLVNVKDGHLRHVNLSQRGEPSMICKVATLSGCPVCHAVSCAASSVCDGCHRAVSCRILSS